MLFKRARKLRNLTREEEKITFIADSQKKTVYYEILMWPHNKVCPRGRRAIICHPVPL